MVIFSAITSEAQQSIIYNNKKDIIKMEKVKFTMFIHIYLNDFVLFSGLLRQSLNSFLAMTEKVVSLQLRAYEAGSNLCFYLSFQSLRGVQRRSNPYFQ
jgi:hypothetical protein